MNRVRKEKTVTLNAANWITVWKFEVPCMLEEIFMKVPTLASATTVTLGIFDPGFETDGDERWNSGTKAETVTYDLLIERLITAGGMLKIKANTTAAENVEIVIYDSE